MNTTDLEKRYRKILDEMESLVDDVERAIQNGEESFDWDIDATERTQRELIQNLEREMSSTFDLLVQATKYWTSSNIFC